MTRYQALRRIGCDPVAASFVALLNWLFDVRKNEIRFMNVTFDIDDSGDQQEDQS